MAAKKAKKKKKPQTAKQKREAIIARDELHVRGVMPEDTTPTAEDLHPLRSKQTRRRHEKGLPPLPRRDQRGSRSRNKKPPVVEGEVVSASALDKTPVEHAHPKLDYEGEPIEPHPTIPHRDTKGRLMAGHNIARGRAVGSVNRFGRRFVQAMEQSFHELGGEEYLLRVAEENPVAYLAAVSKVLGPRLAQLMLEDVQKGERAIVDIRDFAGVGGEEIK